jgi:hypothetical protein
VTNLIWPFQVRIRQATYKHLWTRRLTCYILRARVCTITASYKAFTPLCANTILAVPPADGTSFAVTSSYRLAGTARVFHVNGVTNACLPPRYHKVRLAIHDHGATTYAFLSHLQIAQKPAGSVPRRTLHRVVLPHSLLSRDPYHTIRMPAIARHACAWVICVPPPGW